MTDGGALGKAYQQLRDAKRLEAEARRVIAAAKAAAGPITPSYLANISGLTYEQVLRDIRCGELKTTPVTRGSRKRYQIKRVDAVAWLCAIGLHEIAKLVTPADNTISPAA